MGKMSITIAAAVAPAYTITGEVEDRCMSLMTIQVNTGATNKYVEIIGSGFGVGQQSGAEVITSNKSYTIYVEGFNELSSTENTFRGTVILRVRELTATGEILATVQLSRDHSNTFC